MARRKKKTSEDGPEPTLTEKRITFHAVSGLHLDTLACTGYTATPGTHWNLVRAPHWTAGDWNIRWKQETGAFRAQLPSDAAWQGFVFEQVLLAGLEDVPVNVTRVDLCRDVVGLEVKRELYDFFAGDRSRAGWDKSKPGETITVGSRESDCFLRIYQKYHPSMSRRDQGIVGYKPRLAHEWRQYGWTEAEPVTRIEYELKGRMVERCMPPHGDSETGWNDALARLRLLNGPRAEYARIANARTHRDWLRLGDPGKVTLPPERTPPLLEKLTRASDRVARQAELLGYKMRDFCSLLAILAEPHELDATGNLTGPSKQFNVYTEVKGERIGLRPLRAKAANPEDIDLE